MHSFQHQRPRERKGQQRQQAQIDRQRRAVETAAQALGQSRPNTEVALQPAPAAVDQVQAHMLRQRAGGVGGGGGLAQRDDRLGHFLLGQPMVAGERFHHVAIAVTSGEIHCRIDAGGVLSQQLLHHAAMLDEFAPIDRRQRAQAADAVADRDLVGGLLLRLQLHQMLDALARFGQALLDPAQRQRQRRALSLQPARHLGDERAGHRRVRARHVGDHQHHALGIAFGGCGHVVGPAHGFAAIAPVRHHPRGNAAQVFDQCQPQHDRDRP